MGLSREKREQLRDFIVNNIDKHSNTITSVTAEKFGITRAAAFKHIQKLKADNVIISEGRGRNIKYSLKQEEYEFVLPVSPGMEEHHIWREKMIPGFPLSKLETMHILLEQEN